VPTVVVRHDLPVVAESLVGRRPDLTVVAADDTEAALTALADPDADALVVNPGSWDDALLDGLDAGDWVQSTSVGYDAFPLEGFRERGVRYTNAAGNYAPMVAEHVFALALDHSRRLAVLRAAQRAGEWDRSVGLELGDWLGKRATVVGLGRIGEAVAERALAFDMTVHGTKRDPDAYEGCLPPERVHPPDALADLLPETDLLVLAVPLTDETRGLVDADALAVLLDSAFLVNVARGAVVDEAALVAALEAGDLAGAGLDTFETEPLPADSPLWDREDVLVTPHVAGRSDGFGRRFAALFCDNYDRRRAGEPLRNVVV
jgi:D-2-hydroxyacid dehydrogenase (NADP+)